MTLLPHFYMPDAGNTRVCSGEAAGSKEVEEKKDEGRWDRLTDAYGRTYW